MTSRPADAEFAPYFSRYISLVSENDVFAVLGNQPAELARLASRVAPDRERFRYAAGKWTIREVFGHLTDVERVFSYRAFCISRGEKAPLPSFDENDYVAHSRYNDHGLGDLLSEFTAVREASLMFLRRAENDAWERLGTAGDHPTSVRAMAYIMAGHVRHHIAVLRDRYGILPGS
ncbi:MAG TPA: DinB family protein [Bacteroidota bacterium]|nr:DinB family protein [Bacteroidota bacterium]